MSMMMMRRRGRTRWTRCAGPSRGNPRSRSPSLGSCPETVVGGQPEGMSLEVAFSVAPGRSGSPPRIGERKPCPPGRSWGASTLEVAMDAGKLIDCIMGPDGAGIRSQVREADIVLGVSPDGSEGVYWSKRLLEGIAKGKGVGAYRVLRVPVDPQTRDPETLAALVLVEKGG